MNEGVDGQEKTIFQQKRKLRGVGLLRNRGVLLVLSENFFGASFTIRESMTVIGRKARCDIHVDDPLVSKVHCVITADGEGDFFIEDLGSTNSTFVNRREVQKKMQIFYGDRIVIGNTILRFFLEEKAGSR